MSRPCYSACVFPGTVLGGVLSKQPGAAVGAWPGHSLDFSLEAPARKTAVDALDGRLAPHQDDLGHCQITGVAHGD